MIQFDAVFAELLVGSCPRTALDIERLHGTGVTALLSLQTDADHRAQGVDVRAIERTAEALGMVRVRMPIREFDDDDLIRRLIPAVAGVERLLQVGHRVYLHCSAGLERAPSVAAAYLVRCRGMSLAEAVAAVTAARSCRPREKALAMVLGAGAGQGHRFPRPAGSGSV